MQKQYLLLSAEDCGRIVDWFVFVEVAKRTEIDCLLAGRIVGAASEGNALNVNDSEAFMALVWFGFCSSLLVSQKDRTLAEQLGSIVPAGV